MSTLRNFHKLMDAVQEKGHLCELETLVRRAMNEADITLASDFSLNTITEELLDACCKLPSEPVYHPTYLQLLKVEESFEKRGDVVRWHAPHPFFASPSTDMFYRLCLRRLIPIEVHKDLWLSAGSFAYVFNKGDLSAQELASHEDIEELVSAIIGCGEFYLLEYIDSEVPVVNNFEWESTQVGLFRDLLTSNYLALTFAYAGYGWVDCCEDRYDVSFDEVEFHDV